MLIEQGGEPSVLAGTEIIELITSDDFGYFQAHFLHFLKMRRQRLRGVN